MQQIVCQTMDWNVPDLNLGKLLVLIFMKGYFFPNITKEIYIFKTDYIA